MKKLTTFLIAIMVSVLAYADSNSCPVVNGGGANASLVQTSAQTDEGGCLYVYVSISPKVEKNINVLVNIYDAETGNKVKTTVVSVGWNTGEGNSQVCGLTKEHNYYFKIHNASCR